MCSAKNGWDPNKKIVIKEYFVYVFRFLMFGKMLAFVES